MSKRYLLVAAITCALAVPSSAYQGDSGYDTFKVVGVLTPGQGVQTVSIPLTKGQEITTDVYLIIEVSRLSGPGYRIMFGPDPVAAGAPDTASATLVEHEYPANGDTEKILHLKLDAGTVYMDGSSPYGGTDGGAATSDGSVWMIQRDGDYDRFIYLLEVEAGHSLRVYGKGRADSEVNDIDHFVRVRRSDGAISPVQSIATLPDNAEVRRLVREFAIYADEADLTVPPNWAPPPQEN